MFEDSAFKVTELQVDATTPNFSQIDLDDCLLWEGVENLDWAEKNLFGENLVASGLGALHCYIINY